MAGKIIADQIEHSTAGSLDTSYVVNGSAKAWAAFDMSGTQSFRDSSNFSSITDVAVGTSRFVFTNSMSNADYATTGMSGEQAGGGNRVMGFKGSTATPASTGFDIGNWELSNHAVSDDTRLSVAVFGDLA